MLTYENQMFLDILSSDGLLVSAKGLGLENVLISLMRVYSDPGNLVLVMGTDEDEEEHFIRAMEEFEESRNIPSIPKRITSDNSTSDRQRIYLEGGVLFVTTRILVVDMLMERVPIQLITGILVCKAHRTAESCQESFILRLFRQKNQTGFIKAFSSSPVSFKSNLSKIDRVMRGLFVKNLFLWPRFHADVTECLSSATPEVVELHLDLTPAMMTIQTSVLDLINFTMQELKRINPSLESYDELTVENSLSRSFHRLLQRELDPIWHQLSWKSKQLVSDLKTLRTVLLFLTQYDCITFYAFVSALKTTENAMKSGGWMILDSAESLFITSRNRVLGTEMEDVDIKKKIESTKEKLGLKFEENPKWKAFLEIMKEVEEEECQEEEDCFPTKKVLVLTQDERTSHQLQDLYLNGSDVLLRRMFNKSLGEKFGYIPGVEDAEAVPKNKSVKHKGVGKKSSVQTLTQLNNKDETTSLPKTMLVRSPVIIFQSIQAGTFEVHKVIDEMRPRYAIMYDTEMSVVRQLEVFQAKNPDFPVRVYFLMYDKSVEEQAYLTTLRKEKEAFEHLIREKKTMVIPEDREGRTLGNNPDLVRDSSKASDAIMQNLNGDNAITRKAGGLLDSEAKKISKVIVDMREFRSELPSLIHKRGIEIEPVTIEVGDYILTPDICVERKSISDLIGSLQNGRLYNQATNMTRFYAKPMLLIEFDQNKPFALQGKYYLSRDIASTDITARLQLLTLHFPKLRILWSPSPHATAELFEELKKGREEPDASKAAAMSIDIVDDFNVDRYNPSVFDFVTKLPGITSTNVYAILNSIENLCDLLNLSRDDLVGLLESNDNADLLYEALHNSATSSATETTQNKKKSKGPRFKNKRKKVSM